MGITHITGTAYHPQSQGMVERMHRTLNGLWASQGMGIHVPLAQCILRTMLMKVLNGRSPFEVLLVFRPRMPGSLVSQLQVEEKSTDVCVDRLGNTSLKFMKTSRNSLLNMMMISQVEERTD